MPDDRNRSAPRAATEPARPACAVCGVELIATDDGEGLCVVHRRHRRLVQRSPRPSAAPPPRFAHEVRVMRRPPPTPAPRTGRLRTEPL
ncbi:MAG: hypothetical protein IPH44_28815 [Myxococcales bacterium]|nr:hypothetical protein [Myxococcales bacterium]MBK7191389.1 hypothetical protein [Myxococcales bacterium]MBP6844714.1 hypothetical protein [Kofleriaceae bacterium]